MIAVQETEIQYYGDGTTTSFPIPFDFLDNDHIFVEETDTLSELVSVYTQGTDFTITGGDPGTHVSISPALPSTTRIRIYRSTPVSQAIDYTAGGKFLNETHEQALDKITLILQELKRDVSSAVVSGVSANYAELTAQAVVDGGTITVGSSSTKLVKRVLGSGGHASTSAVTPIDDGTVAWQELLLVGDDDDAILTVKPSTNLVIAGDVVLTKNKCLTLIWDADNSYWMEK